MRDGLVGTTGGDGTDPQPIGDQLAVELREDFEPFDFAIPFILREADESLEHLPIDLAALPPFTQMSRTALSALLGKGDTFVSRDLQSSTLFGDYRVDGSVMNVSGSTESLSRLTPRVGQAQSTHHHSGYHTN